MTNQGMLNTKYSGNYSYNFLKSYFRIYSINDIITRRVNKKWNLGKGEASLE